MTDAAQVKTCDAILEDPEEKTVTDENVFKCKRLS